MAVKEKSLRLVRGFLIALCLFSVCIVSLFFALPYILIAPPRVAQTDVIIHAAIAPHTKSDEYVASLYRQKYAAEVICISSQISVDVYPGDYACAHVVSLGVPPEHARSVRLPITDCPAQGMKTITDFIKAQGWKSALMVSSPETSRYGGWLARRAFSRAQIDLSVTYSPDDKMDLTAGWWKEHRKIQRFVQEAMNIPIDLIYAECR
jgi:hypothetical protein